MAHDGEGINAGFTGIAAIVGEGELWADVDAALHWRACKFAIGGAGNETQISDLLIRIAMFMSGCDSQEFFW